MKKGKGVQIITLISGITLFTSYVVHSQLQHRQTVASSSKSLVLSGSAEQAAEKSKATNVASPSVKPIKTAATNGSSRVAASVKKTNTAAAEKQPMLFPKSKSAPVFSIESGSQAAVPQSQAKSK